MVMVPAHCITTVFAMQITLVITVNIQSVMGLIPLIHTMFVVEEVLVLHQTIVFACLDGVVQIVPFQFASTSLQQILMLVLLVMVPVCPMILVSVM